MKNEITFKVTGNYALFTDPATKIGGEKSTLTIPTYQALKGICESIYWKPSIIWFVDEVCIVNPIRTESKGIRPIKYGGGNDLAYYTYLSDICYIVKAHFEFNFKRKDLQQDFNQNKHYFIAKRCLEKGGRRDIFLGVRECQAYVEECEFDNSESCYKDLEEMSFGLMYHSLAYPDEQEKDELTVKLFTPVMKNGIISFPKPSECPRERVIKKMKMKTFNNDNFSGFNEDGLLDGYKEGDNL